MRARQEEKDKENKESEKFGAAAPGYLTRGLSGISFFSSSVTAAFSYDVSKVHSLQHGKGGGGGKSEGVGWLCKADTAFGSSSGALFIKNK